MGSKLIPTIIETRSENTVLNEILMKYSPGLNYKSPLTFFGDVKVTKYVIKL